MIINIFKIMTLLILSIMCAEASNAIKFYILDDDANKIYAQVLDDDLQSTGFSVHDAQTHIEDIYEDKYGNKNSKSYDKKWSRTLDNLGFYPISNDIKLNKLLKKSPELGAYSSFNLHIYKKIDDIKTYVGHLKPDMMLNIVGIKDKSIRKEFKVMFSSLDILLSDKFGTMMLSKTKSMLASNPMINLELEFDKVDDLNEFIDKFQIAFEDSLEESEYIITGFKDYKEIYTDLEMNFDEYDAYWVYSICNLRYSYELFNKGYPELGVFAPCNIYMYIKKGTNKLMIGMPRLSNWASLMSISDKKIIKDSKRIDANILSIIKSLGADEI